MQALHDVVRTGKVRYIGMSSCWAWQFQLMQSEPYPPTDIYIADSLAYALNNRLTPFISMQNQHNAIYREEEREMMPMLKHYGVGTVPWGPIAAGCWSRFTSFHSWYPELIKQYYAARTRTWIRPLVALAESKMDEENSHPTRRSSIPSSQLPRRGASRWRKSLSLGP